MGFEAIDPGFEARVRDSFRQQAVMATIGAELADVAPGACEIVLPYDPGLAQQHGFLHAGIVSTVLDSACGYAAFTLMPAGAGVVAVEFKVNFLRPAVGELLIGRGRVVRAGKTLTVCAGDAFMRADGVEAHVAVMQSTISRVGS